MEIRRDIYLDKLIAAKHNGLIKIVTGIRRCGKSYLLFKLFYDHLRSSGVDDGHIIRVDLEDRRNKALRDPDALITYIDSHMADDAMHYVMLDEVQNVADFEDVLNSYLKVTNADLYVTGSNSRFLSHDVVTKFRGRGYEIRVRPLSFAEFVSAFDGTREEALDRYLTYGGLPQLLTLPDDGARMDYLQGLFEKTYLTDIKERYNIKNDAELAELLGFVASSIGGLTNPTKLMNTFRTVKHVSMSANTIKSYLDIAQDAYLIERSVRYDIKGKRYIDTPAKYYFTDLGLRNARPSFRQHEVTHLVENLVYNELRTKGIAVDVGVVVANYKNEEGGSRRQQLEIDFVCNRGNSRCYVQSALHLPDEAKRQQEVRSLRLVNDNFRKYVITADPVQRYQDDDGVTYINLYDFLLDRTCPEF